MVGIVILNYNNSTDTLNCVDSILNHNSYPVKIVVVDNGSTNKDVIDAISRGLNERFGNHCQIIKEGVKPATLSQVTFLICEQNEGYARGNNKGLELLYNDDEIKHVMILNSDILFVEDIIGTLVENLETKKDAAIVSPILYKKNLQGIDYTCARKVMSLSDLFIYYLLLGKDFNGILSRRSRKRNLLIDKTLPLEDPLIQIELPSGSCMLATKKLFHKIGSFDPNTFLYNEENILWAKIKKIGKINYLDTRCKCIHLGATTTGSKVPSRFILECSLKSNHYYLKNYTDACWFYLTSMRLFYGLMRLKLILKTTIS